jgi:hypothetical protein
MKHKNILMFGGVYPKMKSNNILILLLWMWPSEASTAVPRRRRTEYGVRRSKYQ